MFVRSQISLSLGSHGWLCNTVEEVEPLGMKVLRKYLKLSVRAIGPLLPLAALQKQYPSSSFGSNRFKQRAGKKPGISPEKYIEWLNLHGPGCVLYISFGSQNTVNASQMMELALGLEALESLSQGVPIIGLPMGAEQMYNSKMLVEEMGVCEELARGVQSDAVGKKVIKRVIELVMDKKKGKGKEMQKKAAIIGEQIRAAAKDRVGEGEGSSLLEALDDFVSASSAV
ncbi:hypothetical protein FH972_013085 [Carpinus fangiana]|uniref:Uncharacterized protein n=1 Tax=Carpinus fangiana TaxID=176857 RepID=A0A5N6R5R6_9ROSI|nr:hypothetical protein FH972_013085 [Carpinus fangiana]